MCCFYLNYGDMTQIDSNQILESAEMVGGDAFDCQMERDIAEVVRVFYCVHF